MEIKQISAQPQFTAIKATGLTQKQRAIYNKLEPLFEAVTDHNGYDLYVTRSENPYVHQKSGRYEHCAQMLVTKDGENIGLNSKVPNTTRAWVKAFGEVTDSHKTPLWKLYKAIFTKMSK